MGPFHSFPPPGYLEDNQCHKPRVVIQVPSPQPPRFLAQSVEPFQPDLLYPLRGLALCPGMKIKGGSHSDHDSPNLPFMFCDPALLFWAAQPDEQYPDAGAVYRFDDLFILRLGESPKWRTKSEGNL